MAPRPMPARLAPPSPSTDPLPAALAALLERRGMTLADLGSLLRAEGLAISRTRLHQLAHGNGAAPTSDQLERLASVLGVSPGHFAEYRLWRARCLLDPAVVGFARAMANFERLRGRRDLPDRAAEVARAPRYPGRVSPSKERA